MNSTTEIQRGTKTSPLAIASIIFSIAGFTILPWLGSVFAIITGKLALSEIRSRPDRFEGEGLARAGVTLGWIGTIGIFVLAVLAVIFLAPVRMVGPVMIP